MNKLIIIGAGGHGKVIADNALKNGYTNISFIDDCIVGDCIGFPVIGDSSEIEKFDDGNTDFIIGIGDNKIRKMIAEKHNVNWVTLIHPSAQVAFNASIGKGTVIMAGAVVNTSAVVGSHVIINTCAVVEHDNIIGDYVHISPNAALGGTVKVGKCAHVAIGAIVKNNVDICDSCIIGVGSVVVKDIKEVGTYVGVPAHKFETTYQNKE